MNLNIYILFFIVTLTSYSQEIYHFDIEFVYETRSLKNDRLIHTDRFYCSTINDKIYLIEGKIKNKAVSYYLYDFEKKLFFSFKTENLFDSKLGKISNSIYGALNKNCENSTQDIVIERINSSTFRTTAFINKAKNKIIQKIDYSIKESKKNYTRPIYWTTNLFNCKSEEIYGVVTLANIYNKKGKKISTQKLVAENTIKLKIDTNFLITNDE